MFKKKSSLSDTSKAVFIPTSEHLEQKRKEKLKVLRSARPMETDQEGDIALGNFCLNHRLLADIGEREVLHKLHNGSYGKPGDRRYDYTSAWVKDQEYERMIDYADEALDVAKEAKDAAKIAAAAALEANELARRAIATAKTSVCIAKISAAIAVVSTAIAMIALITAK